MIPGDLAARLRMLTDEKCQKCGLPMVIKWGKMGHFLACTGYPKCRNAKDVDKEGNICTWKVLSLRRYKIDDDRWKRAMRADSTERRRGARSCLVQGRSHP